ncbi:hypothetical protein GCM10009853_042840 [Glycomyces scopariae]|uniref:LPXTG-motif cell wall anchor domain-containing protein n=1 Tax=Glycomyces sambucus TaxID=380244 RepID=A0A1G9DYL9_9ACTN|nr:LPXTG cell wall anchor domain-containing protein [Glycomyces sambucus]SDK68939.1 LPXTG-motif cell wall anchor domain-containing protein [Glycomyces sambucus]
MKALILRTSAVTAVSVLAWAAPAQAQPQTLPVEPVKLYLKEHEPIPLAEEGGAIVLSADFDLWSFRSVEAFQEIGEFQIVHDESGRCLTADTSGGEETEPVALADCADAITWTAEYDDRPGFDDLRFATGDGYFLGLADGVAAVQGAAVLAVEPESGNSRHFQEWLVKGEIEEPPPPTSPPPSESPSPSPSESAPPSETTPGSPSEQPGTPKLPTTGAGLGMAVGAGAVALAGGAALVLWWQRRRALRHW